jgi:hypothetical protein
MGMLRVGATLVGVWMGAVAPVEAVVEVRRVANAANGHVPNMEPGVVLVIAVMFAVGVAALILLSELVRCWALGGAPLKASTHLFLGVLAASPIGLAFTVEWFQPTSSVVAVLVGALILLFYSVMGVRSSRRRSGIGSSNGA